MENVHEGAQDKKMKLDSELDLEKLTEKDPVEDSSYLREFKFYESVAFGRSLIVEDLIASKSYLGIPKAVEVIMNEVAFELMKSQQLGLILNSNLLKKLAEDIGSHLEDHHVDHHFHMEIPEYLREAAPIIKITEIQKSFFVLDKNESMLKQLVKFCDLDVQGHVENIAKAKLIISKFMLSASKDLDEKISDSRT